MAPKTRKVGTVWFVLYCAEDESHCMVRENDVICDPSATVGDTVQFFFNRKTPYEGIIKDLGEDEAKMRASLQAFNAKKGKREPSFHEGSPRKSKKQGKSSIRTWTGSTKNLTATSECKGPKISSKVTNKEVNLKKKNHTEDMSDGGNCSRDKPVESSSDSELDSKDDEDSSDSDISLEVMAKLEKLAKKRKLSDLNDLLKLNHGNRQQRDPYCKPLMDQNRKDEANSAEMESTSNQARNISKSAKEHDDVFDAIGDSTEENTSPPKDQASPSTSNCKGTHPTPEDHGGPSSAKDQDSRSSPKDQDDTSGSDDETPNTSSEKSTKSAAIVRRRYRPAYTKAIFTGNYFNHSKDDPGVVQLNDKYEVYVSKQGLSLIKRNGKSGTDTARMLLMEVFSPQTVEECSVTGRPAAGRGKEQANLRPPLDPNGVAAIHAYAVARAKKKGWKIPEVKDTNKALADKLGETRYYKKLEEQAKSVATP